MEATTEPSKLWSNAQAYGMAMVCLLVGIAAGYLLHPPKPFAVGVPQAPSARGIANGGMPTPEQLKHMGDEQAKPLLAALQKEPNNSELLAQIGTIYSRAQQFPIAVDYYERAAKIKPSAELLVSLSNAYHYAGADDRAIETLNHALQLDPKSANALFNLGMLKWQVQNDPEAAIQAWQQLLKMNPNHPRRAQVENMIAKAKQHINMPAAAKTDKPAM